MITVHSHKEIERYEVSSDTAEGLNLLLLNLTNNYGFKLKDDWEEEVEGKVLFFAIFERESKDLLVEQ